ncbi:3-methyl-2-oxobutanoate hydroxymethyltransferase [Cohaesibacter gelatinilyticus]|uniref:3-methyl-2-oxobutanoate hydroxymethyltransferase n=1 Tax=Cohaesibacter gelatinilyticus TaxID=372072 RepID=A0A285NLI2_9HYPH|nr:3-methyl-2-oxobutanoate hydroxymethyltransferase [Cohaesibacter gelatinilyticus]SNZ08726.1 ketopantoate hydroxymethyltransferase [Cohaesibacter gelatinilyticus]
MKSIYTWDAQPAKRNLTAADILAAKGQRKLVQTTANNEEEAASAADAGLDMIMGNAHNTEAIRKGAPHLFFTAALGLPDFPTESDILKAAFAALKAGADSIYTARGPNIVELLAREDIPVMGHLGLVPRKSTWRGGLRAVGKTADEALALYQDFKRLETAGAFSVEAEIIPALVMKEITQRTSLITCSLGSGPDGDVIYLFQDDICGKETSRPRHARAFGNLYKLNQQIKAERRKALRAFKDATISQSYPSDKESAQIEASEWEQFLEGLDRLPTT